MDLRRRLCLVQGDVKSLSHPLGVHGLHDVLNCGNDLRLDFVNWNLVLNYLYLLHRDFMLYNLRVLRLLVLHNLNVLRLHVLLYNLNVFYGHLLLHNLSILRLYFLLHKLCILRLVRYNLIIVRLCFMFHLLFNQPYNLYISRLLGRHCMLISRQRVLLILGQL
ncbi:hypothetical protein FJT64_020361 [Amphibalanus amphitrite]|uniref:Uncharacterized protein n=1 Tax=Amphibalanus amphitrite TaxID=1232801 RepID=A0A6A4X0S4_AMPAM|nr:hypothetical protein FJT64_020361 [Amphibalanus amphitrite]